MTPDDLKKRTNDFSHRCVKLALSLPNDPVSNHIRHQMIRSSTSVSANYRAACLGHSKAAFTSKISIVVEIVVEEIDETAFWIEFLVEEGLLLIRKCESLLGEAKELTSIFIASRKTSQHSK